MTTTIETQFFKINGVIDTNKSVWENLETLTSAAGCWLAFDIHTGKWSVIINRAGSSVHSFNDSNILGGINVSGTGLYDLYNSVSVTFPNKEIYDLKDVSVYEIPLNERNPGEFTNRLNLNFDIVNDVIHAQMLALTELHQARVDKIIEFRTDYSKLALKAGDIIDVTNTALGYAAKKFRVISISEEDADDNNIQLAVTALEYSDAVYDYSKLNRFVREPNNQLIQKKNNEEIQELDDQDISRAMEKMLLANVATGLLNLLFERDPITKKLKTILNPKDAARDKLLSSIKPCLTISGSTTVCEGANVIITLTPDATTACLFDLSQIEYSYEITGVAAGDINFPLTGTYSITGANKTFIIPTIVNSNGPHSLVFTTQGLSRTVIINNQLPFTYVTTANPTTITEGQSSTVTLTTTGLDDGTVVPYAITGTGTARVSTALTGTVTVNSNTATLTVNTIDDGVFTGNQSVTVTFNAAQADPCGQLDKTASITINDNDTPPPQPPADKTCQYVSVPLVWCAVYDGADDQLKNMTVRKSVQLAVAQAGEATTTVPLTVSVTKGNPSTVNVLTSATVASSNQLGGMPCQLITTFNTVAPLGLITGTTTTLYGHD
jgi:hypothetical protein